MAPYKEYDIIDPGNEESLRERLVRAASTDSPFPITARERLDELTARRRDPIETGFLLEIVSMQFGKGGFAIIKLNESETYGRIEYGPGQLTLTMTESNDTVAP